MKKGFTLLELLVVIAIIGIVIGIGTGTYGLIVRQSRDAKRVSDLNMIRSALEAYRTQNNVYPSNKDPLLTPPASGPSYLKSWPKDPTTGQLYTYTVVGTDYALCGKFETKSTSSTTGCIQPCGTQNCNYLITSQGE